MLTEHWHDNNFPVSKAEERVRRRKKLKKTEREGERIFKLTSPLWLLYAYLKHGREGVCVPLNSLKERGQTTQVHTHFKKLCPNISKPLTIHSRYSERKKRKKLGQKICMHFHSPFLCSFCAWILSSRLWIFVSPLFFLLTRRLSFCFFQHEVKRMGLFL
jgi:hypothetical protein